ncbi:anterior gradient protein 3-like [Lethenteron reissneri]|uniref:anterior gradient protein 3-like n=1 Tax=Lethenteron reissneri TaxID=7753 RepID=UPI002AB615C3|nr:anterior gradient protein 3-like [Lethenteron reissneri]
MMKTATTLLLALCVGLALAASAKEAKPGPASKAAGGAPGEKAAGGAADKATTAPPKRKGPQTLSRGWGDDITWVQTYEEGLAKSRNTRKPLMVIHHLEDCPYSNSLKKVFVESKDIQRMAQEDFIMLNLLHETTDKHLAPDGHYVPRIIFVDPSLTVRADITGKYSNRLYAYEPIDVELLEENMRKARKMLHTEL